ncbi:hypothetical protein FJY90_01315 [Candidatus Gottesmanbacteria bacterium]|nr:hypothetical protein [Candidatus Gottesmanbacteria bacterium]
MIADKKRHVFYYFITGLAIGFSWYFYLAPRILPLWILVFFFWRIIFRQYNIKNALIYIGVLFFGFFLISGPLIWYFIQHKDAFFARILGHIDYGQNNSFLDISLDNFILVTRFYAQKIFDAFKIFIIPGTVSFAYYRVTPIHFIPASIFLCLGLLFLIIRHYKTLDFYIILLFISILIFGALLTDILLGRYLIIIPFTCLLVALGLSVFVRKITANNYFRSILEISIVVLIIINELPAVMKFMFIDVYNEDYHAQVSTYSGKYIVENNLKNKKVFFLTTDSLFYDAIKSAKFFSGKEGRDLVRPLNTELLLTEGRIDSLYIIPNGRFEDTEVLKSLFPEGRLISLSNPLNTMVAYIFIN